MWSYLGAKRRESIPHVECATCAKSVWAYVCMQLITQNSCMRLYGT